MFKLFILSTFLLTLVIPSHAAGKYSSEDFVICDVPITIWPEIEIQGYLRPAPYTNEAFIHCAKPSQVYDVMNKYFTGGPYKMFITHKSKFGNELVYENGYPHVYHYLELSKVDFMYTQIPENDGTYLLPDFFKSDDDKI